MTTAWHGQTNFASGNQTATAPCCRGNGPIDWKYKTRSIPRMRAMVLEKPGTPLRLSEIAQPKPKPGEVLIQVRACAVCRTDLHVIDGELPNPKLPLVPGHEIVGTVVEAGSGANWFNVGARVGVPWLGWTCGECVYCLSDRENLCD